MSSISDLNLCRLFMKSRYLSKFTFSHFTTERNPSSNPLLDLFSTGPNPNHAPPNKSTKKKEQWQTPSKSACASPPSCTT